jgi:hypothetical protein
VPVDLDLHGRDRGVSLRLAHESGLGGRCNQIRNKIKAE